MLVRGGQAIRMLSRETCSSLLWNSSGGGYLVARNELLSKALRPLRGRPITLHHAPQPWSEEECNQLLKLKSTGLNWKAVAANFPGRTVPALCVKFYRLKRLSGGQRKTSKAWTNEELEKRNALRAKGLTWPEISQQIPGRSIPAVMDAHLRCTTPPGRKTRRWTDQEIAQLRYLVEDLELSWEEVTRRTPARSRASLRAKYWSISGPITSWFTPKESKLIQDLRSQGVSFAKMAESLPGRSAGTIRLHWHRNHPEREHFRSWSDSEDSEMLRMREQGKTWNEIGRVLGRSPKSLYPRFKKMGRPDLFHKFGPALPRHWAAAEDSRLKELREQGLPWLKIGEAIGCHGVTARNRYVELFGHTEWIKRLPYGIRSAHLAQKKMD